MAKKKNQIDESRIQIRVQQIASPIRRPRIQLEYLKGLGLGKINRVSILSDTPTTRGLIKKAIHMIKYEVINNV